MRISHFLKDKTGILFAVLLCVVATAFMVVWSCAPSGYGDPEGSATTTKTPTALISAETLKDWMDQGKVNQLGGYDRVVILDIGTSKEYYDRGHIPGAIYVDITELIQTRVEGVAPSAEMAADGTKMDALIQKCGIDCQNTTIVFTSPSNDAVFRAARGYVTFRYWGFPRERLKVLDGWDNGWKALYPLTSEAPVIARSTYAVTPYGVNRVQTALRVSLGEMIAAVQRIDAETQAGTPTGVIIDGRSAASAGCYAGVPGATTAVFSPNATGITTDYVVFEGRMKNAKAIDYKTLYDAANANRYFLADTLTALFTAIGMDSTKTAYVYCRTGNIATALFFALDGILGWNAVWYDGSWSQWAQMSTDSANGGKLPVSAAAWATDTAALSEVVVHNFGQTVSGTTLTLNHIEALPVDSAAASQFTTTTDPGANQIENEDTAYRSPAAAGGSGGSSGGGNTGC